MDIQEFKRSLATAVGRETLGVPLTSEEAAVILADDELLASTFEWWSNSGGAGGVADASNPGERSYSSYARSRGQHRGKTWWIVGGAAGAVVLATVALAAAMPLLASHADQTRVAHGHAASVENDFTATGTLRIHSTANNPCFYTAGLEDVQEGGSVVVTDASGNTVGLGELSNPVHETWGYCTLDWSVSGIPSGGKFYGVEVGHRGVVTFSESDFREGPNALTVG